MTMNQDRQAVIVAKPANVARIVESDIRRELWVDVRCPGAVLR